MLLILALVLLCFLNHLLDLIFAQPSLIMWWWFCSSGQWSCLLQRHSECHLHNVKTCSDLWNSLGGLEESQRAQICQEGLGPKYMFAPPCTPGSSLHQLSQDQETRELHQEAKDPALFHFLHHCKWHLVLQSSKQQLHQDWCFCKVSVPLEKSWSSCCTSGFLLTQHHGWRFYSSLHPIGTSPQPPCSSWTCPHSSPQI